MLFASQEGLVSESIINSSIRSFKLPVNVTTYAHYLWPWEAPRIHLGIQPLDEENGGNEEGSRFEPLGHNKHCTSMEDSLVPSGSVDAPLGSWVINIGNNGKPSMGDFPLVGLSEGMPFIDCNNERLQHGIEQH